MAENSRPTRDEWLREADKYDSLKQTVSIQILENARFLKTDISSWYNGLAAVCFTAGTIAITLSSDKIIRQSISYPTYFWWGSALLLVNGVYIFFLKKSEIEKEDRSFYKLRETEADMWTLRNVSREMADGRKDRASEFEKVKTTQSAAYNAVLKKWRIREWIPHLFLASRIDIIFGLLLFPVLMIASQIISELGINFITYKRGFFVILFGYIIYSLSSAHKSANSVKKSQTADRRIRDEVYSNN